MEIQLSHFLIYSPDELLPYWFVSHDFAKELNLEFSKDAASAIKKVSAGRGVRIDYEADAVTLRISKNEMVIPTLIALYSLLGWDETELNQYKAQVAAFKRPRPRKLSIGDIFQIPFTDNLVALGQILEINSKSPTVAVFTGVGTLSEMTSLEPSHSSLLTILHIGGDSLYKGEWPIIGNTPPFHDPSSGPGGKQFSVGSTSYGGNGPIIELLLAYEGRRSWSEGFHDPQYLRKLVMA